MPTPCYTIFDWSALEDQDEKAVVSGEVNECLSLLYEDLRVSNAGFVTHFRGQYRNSMLWLFACKPKEENS